MHLISQLDGATVHYASVDDSYVTLVTDKGTFKDIAYKSYIKLPLHGKLTINGAWVGEMENVYVQMDGYVGHIHVFFSSDESMYKPQPSTIFDFLQKGIPQETDNGRLKLSYSGIDLYIDPEDENLSSYKLLFQVVQEYKRVLFTAISDWVKGEYVEKALAEAAALLDAENNPFVVAMPLHTKLAHMEKMLKQGTRKAEL